MIDMVSLDSDSVIGCVINGKINSDDIEKISTEIEKRLNTHDKLRVYVEVKDLGGISLDALLKDLKMGFKHYNNFVKKAVVTDKEWMKKIAPAVNKIFTNIDVKCFSFEDKDKARKWVQA